METDSGRIRAWESLNLHPRVEDSPSLPQTQNYLPGFRSVSLDPTAAVLVSKPAFDADGETVIVTMAFEPAFSGPRLATTEVALVTREPCDEETDNNVTRLPNYL